MTFDKSDKASVETDNVFPIAPLAIRRQSKQFVDQPLGNTLPISSAAFFKR
jgi:hypothetical protein